MTEKKRLPLQDRLIAALREAGGQIAYYELARKLWPPGECPKAWRGATKGGPHGWAMPLGRALGVLSRAGVIHDGRMTYERKISLR